MKSKLGILLRIQFLGSFGFNRLLHETDRKKKRKSIALMLVFALAAIIMGAYCFAFAFGLGKLGLAELIPGYALTVTAVITLIFTFLKTNGYLFAFKDYDLLLALPVRTETVITAKFLYMYLSNLIFTMLVMAPMAAGYGLWQPVGPVGLLSWLLGIIIAPLLPMTIAAAAGVLIAAIGSGFKHKTLVQTLISVLLFVALFGVIFWIGSSVSADEEAFIAQLGNLSATISETMQRLYPPCAWFASAVNRGSLSGIALLLGFSLVWYGAFVLIVGRLYRKINTVLMSAHSGSRSKPTALKTHGVVMAVVQKEARRFFSSTNYLMNSGMGLIMALVAVGASIFVGIDSVLAELEIALSAEMRSGIVFALPFAIAMLVNMTCTSSVSLSLEGRNLWIVESLPISLKSLYQGKILFNILLVAPVSLLCSIIIMAQLHVSALQALFYIAVSVVTSVFSSVLGMWINIHFPKFDWENEIEVIKQSAATAFGIFAGMLGYLLLAALTFAVSTKIPGELVLLSLLLLLAAGAWLLYRACVNSDVFFGARL